MATLYHRTRSNANASLISMAQRFSDVVIIFFGIVFSLRYEFSLV
ncbi:undecaprenyl-phosphate glucose phosphotransferase [Klebsiella aerogenes]|nr:undecaprenyl-phosphate glucose phosphotransferase [Klebsiella aerogenes]